MHYNDEAARRLEVAKEGAVCCNWETKRTVVGQLCAFC